MIDLEKIRKEFEAEIEYSKTGFAHLKLNPETYMEMISALEEAKEIIKSLSSTAETHAMQTYSKVSSKNATMGYEWLNRYFPEEKR